MSQKEYPILLTNVHKIPVENITCSQHEDMMRGYKFLTYDCMIQSNLTVRHLTEMGCDMTLVLNSWATPHTAENLLWTGTDKDTLMAVYMALQVNRMPAKFSKIDWFKIGLTVLDMINMKLPVRVYKTFNITFESIVEKKAHEYGETWQNVFNWSDEDWKSLGFTEASHQEYKNKVHNNFNVSETKRKVMLNFGPRYVQDVQ